MEGYLDNDGGGEGVMLKDFGKRRRSEAEEGDDGGSGSRSVEESTADTASSSQSRPLGEEGEDPSPSRRDCSPCGRSVERGGYSKRQWGLRNGICAVCVTSRDRQPSRCECRSCGKSVEKGGYSNKQWKGRDRGAAVCRECSRSSPGSSASDDRPDRSNGDSTGTKNAAAPSRRPNKRRRNEEERLEDEEAEEDEDPLRQTDPLDRKRFEFHWPTHPVPKDDEERMGSVVIRRGEFGPLDDERFEEVEGVVADTVAMDLDQALSLRDALLMSKATKCHYQLEFKGKVMLKLYKRGSNVNDLAERFDLPPMGIFRTLLSQMDWSKSKIKKSLRNPKLLEGRERIEFDLAEASDNVMSVNQKDSVRSANAFERFLAEWFEERGVRLLREEDIRKEQKAGGGGLLTPDVLFLDRVEINGSEVAWLDAKNFYGADVPQLRAKLRQQMGRYVERWGAGAVVYRHGFSERLRVPGCSLLDATPLDLSELGEE